MKFSPDPFLLLETSAFRCIAAYSTVSVETPALDRKEAKTSAVSVKKEQKIAAPDTAAEERKPNVLATTAPASQKSEHSGSGQKPTDPFDFSRFVEHIRTVPKRSFVGLGLRVSTYSEEDNTIVIHPDNDFNYQKLDSADVRLFLQETLDALFGEGYRVDVRR